MSDSRPLPTVIGPTENALRALLTRTLSMTPIAGYTAWVVLNTAEKVGHESELRGAVESQLHAEPAVIDHAIADLRERGMLGADGEGITSTGAAVLESARADVRAVTQGLVGDVTEADQEATRRALDAIRRRAEQGLAR
ncbi:hypothetical protein [Microbacterium gorillae]|uniref:hypothetical protein n=1 Tax=Microbacterium gorillae TaxID=1231063 RepID=UPI00058C5BB6|nr:hypothetical protein [Microbacterium gorillae]